MLTTTLTMTSAELLQRTPRAILPSSALTLTSGFPRPRAQQYLPQGKMLLELVLPMHQLHTWSNTLVVDKSQYELSSFKKKLHIVSINIYLEDSKSLRILHIYHCSLDGR